MDVKKTSGDGRAVLEEEHWYPGLSMNTNVKGEVTNTKKEYNVVITLGKQESRGIHRNKMDRGIHSTEYSTMVVHNVNICKQAFNV